MEKEFINTLIHLHFPRRGCTTFAQTAAANAIRRGNRAHLERMKGTFLNNLVNIRGLSRAPPRLGDSRHGGRVRASHAAENAQRTDVNSHYILRVERHIVHLDVRTR